MRNRKRFLVLCVLVAGCVIATAAALLRYTQVGKHGGAGELPNYVDVIVNDGRTSQKTQLRDPNDILLLLSMIDDGTVVPAQRPASPPFSVFIPPPDRKSYTYTPSPIWLSADEYVIQRNDTTTQLNGNFADFVEWLKIRRLNQLRQSLQGNDRQLAKELLNQNGDAYLDSLLRILHSPNPWFAQAGIGEIAGLVSEKPVVPDFVMGRVYVPQLIGPNDRQKKAEQALLAVLAQITEPDSSAVFGDVIICLQQIGGRSTAAALFKLPIAANSDSSSVRRLLLSTVEILCGIPPTDQRLFICGNSTATELRRAEEAQRKRQAEAFAELAAWHQQHAADDHERFMDAVVARWSEVLIHFADQPNSYTYPADQTPAKQVATLLGRGLRMLPALKRRRAAATDWREVAMLSFCIAALSRECDSDLVSAYLEGDTQHQRLACCMIAATGEDRWTRKLTQLLRTPIPSQDIDEAVALRGVAAQALYNSIGAAALPDLKAAAAAGFESQVLIAIVDHCETPVQVHF